MDGAAAAGGGGGGPAPFLLKTYDMVDDSSTDEIVSWSSSLNSFVVWNPPEFARLLLPTYFKHNNFSSFIRQLNTYGFRKIDPERWEFANEEFVKGQKHLLKNIYRRKPIHSHSHPQGDSERAAFDEEIDKLSREKAALESNLARFKQQQSTAKLHLEELTQRVGGMEQRQEKLLTFLEKAVQDRNFVEHLAQKLEFMDVSVYNKKRRLPEVDNSIPVLENSYVDNHNSSRSEFGNIFQQDFSNKLRLELSPAVSDGNLVSRSTQSSNEEGASPEKRMSEGYVKDTQMAAGVFLFSPETLELSDTGTSFTFKMASSLSCRAGKNNHEILGSNNSSNNNAEEEEGDGISCHLNLTLASSSSLQADKSHGIGKSIEPRYNKEVVDFGVSRNKIIFSEDDRTLSSSPPPIDNQQEPPAPVRVNDVFWEQFLTERPGSSDTEEASSNFKANPSYDQQEDRRRSGHGMPRNGESFEDHLTL